MAVRVRVSTLRVDVGTVDFHILLTHTSLRVVTLTTTIISSLRVVAKCVLLTGVKPTPLGITLFVIPAIAKANHKGMLWGRMVGTSLSPTTSKARGITLTLSQRALAITGSPAKSQRLDAASAGNDSTRAQFLNLLQQQSRQMTGHAPR